MDLASPVCLDVVCDLSGWTLKMGWAFVLVLHGQSIMVVNGQLRWHGLKSKKKIYIAPEGQIPYYKLAFVLASLLTKEWRSVILAGNLFVLHALT